jgi:hypothetical protein
MISKRLMSQLSAGVRVIPGDYGEHCEVRGVVRSWVPMTVCDACPPVSKLLAAVGRRNAYDCKLAVLRLFLAYLRDASVVRSCINVPGPQPAGFADCSCRLHLISPGQRGSQPEKSYGLCRLNNHKRPSRRLSVPSTRHNPEGVGIT